MASNNKRIAKNTLFLYIRMFITMAISLFTVRIVMNTLGVSNYGVYNAVGGVVLSMTFLSRVLSIASTRFFSIDIGNNEIEGLKRNFGTIFFVYIALALIIFLIAEIVGVWFVSNKMTIPEESYTAAQYAYQFAIFSFLVTIIVNPFQALIIAHEEMDVYAYVSVLEVVLKLAIVYLLYISPIDKLITYSFLIFLSTLLSYSIYIFYCIKKFRSELSCPFWDKNKTKEVLSYSSWSLFGTLSGACVNQGMTILLNLFYGPIANAAFAVANNVSNSVRGFAANFVTATKPPIIKNYAQKDYKELDRLFYSTTNFSFVLLFGIILPVYVRTDIILKLWLGNIDQYMVEFVHIVLIYSMILLLGDPITTIVQASGKVKQYHLTVDGFTLVCLPIAIIVSKSGAGATLTLVVIDVVFALAHILRLVIVKRIIPFSYLTYIKKSIIPIVLIVFFSFVFSCFVDNLFDNNILGILFFSGTSFVFVVVLSFMFLLTTQERTMLITFLKKYLKKWLTNTSHH